jgi:hypothetical protein
MQILQSVCPGDWQNDMRLLFHKNEPFGRSSIHISDFGAFIIPNSEKYERFFTGSWIFSEHKAEEIILALEYWVSASTPAI